IGVEYPGMEFTSLASLVNNPGDMSAIAGIWDSIEVFSIWGYIITAIGLQIVAGFSKKMAWSVVVVIFLLTIMIELMSSALAGIGGRSEEHTSELQSRFDLVCRLLLAKKNKE